MGLPIDAKTDWQAVCNEEAILCSPNTLRNAFRFIVSVLGENGINAPKATLPPLNTNPRQWLEPEHIPPLIAAEAGQSVNAYILQAVKERIQKENINNH